MIVNTLQNDAREIFQFASEGGNGGVLVTWTSYGIRHGDVAILDD